MTPEPIDLFHTWYAEAHAAEDLADAVCLATSTPDGFPSARMVLLKAADADGFVFYTNLGSQKAKELAENPNAALCFHWKSLKRQVRVMGAVTPVADATADAAAAKVATTAAVAAQAKAVAAQAKADAAADAATKAAAQAKADAAADAATKAAAQATADATADAAAKAAVVPSAPRLQPRKPWPTRLEHIPKSAWIGCMLWITFVAVVVALACTAGGHDGQASAALAVEDFSDAAADAAAKAAVQATVKAATAAAEASATKAALMYEIVTMPMALLFTVYVAKLASG